MNVNNFTVHTLFGNDVNISDNKSFFDFHVIDHYSRYMYMYRKAFPALFDHGSDCNDWPIKVEK